MKLRMPAYFRQFQCTCGACPDTCCRDWSIALEPETAAFYRTVDGPLGADLTRAMAADGDGACLALAGGLCPMLDGDGLCRIQRQLGEARLSQSCRLYPRFAEEYGALREWCLTMACPEAARLLLADAAPVQLVEETTDEPLSGCNDLDARRFYDLLAARRTAFAIVQDRSAPWQQRLGWLLAFAQSLQRALDGRRMARLERVTARYAAGYRPRRTPGTDPAGAAALLPALRDLEAINGRWTDLLDAALAAPRTEADRRRFAAADGPWAHEYEHLLHYFLYRYFLKAVVDRRLLPRVQLAAFAVLAVRELTAARWPAGADGPARIDVLHRFSREVEHSEENRTRLLDRLAARPELSPAALTAAAW